MDLIFRSSFSESQPQPNTRQKKLSDDCEIGVSGISMEYRPQQIAG
jgi:hypothetical protein